MLSKASHTKTIILFNIINIFLYFLSYFKNSVHLFLRFMYLKSLSLIRLLMAIDNHQRLTVTTLKGRRSKKSLNCPNCYGAIVYPEGLEGEKICTQCGLVIDEIPAIKGFTKYSPEWHSNWNEQDSGTLKEWLTTLRVVSCQLNLPNFPYREEAAYTIRTQNRLLFKSQKLSKNKRATVAALMHLVLKEYDKVRSIKAISKDLSLDSALVTKHAWILNKTLKTEQEHLKIQRKTAVDYLHENAAKLTVNKELFLSAESILLELRGSGGNPIALAAGALYYVCKKKTNISKEEIGEVFGISPRTVYSNEAKIRIVMATKPRTKAAPLIICQLNSALTV
jgi:transcription initiation factor TFIIIB Brf1 subunit/transcription initiation factor TFIIB